jgi:hypothetical protein
MIYNAADMDLSRKAESPESLIIPPYKNRDGREAPEDITLKLCDNCKWCCTCLDGKQVFGPCPLCGVAVSHIPMTTEEYCHLQHDDKRGMTLEFGRRF